MYSTVYRNCERSGRRCYIANVFNEEGKSKQRHAVPLILRARTLHFFPAHPLCSQRLRIVTLGESVFPIERPKTLVSSFGRIAIHSNGTVAMLLLVADVRILESC